LKHFSIALFFKIYSLSNDVLLVDKGKRAAHALCEIERRMLIKFRVKYYNSTISSTALKR
jgi:hypothetical protein